MEWFGKESLKAIADWLYTSNSDLLRVDRDTHNAD